ncbi:hypothetical protein PHYBOEH_002096 [Phytophthora boehmeriae]|uniref:[F-actin]-monooxygenase MICAL1-3-like Rossman domain-containing protein n=1 Tax=Phytophthora boehmeriae TaxID=109152 RepID=A0A8T1X531_9STRA|nr:hypothetical protein PHYBOEH_002096 [Phytophthora boehmeriae]
MHAATVSRSERRPPVHDRVPDMAPTATHRQDVYIGEGLIDTEELDDEFDEGGDHYNKSSRKVLDYLATDVAERYLDGIYQEDEGGDNTDSDDGSLSNDEAPAAGKQGLPTIWRPAIMKLNEEEVSTNHEDHKTTKETDRKKRARTDKELAWQKVRQCLIEEEHQAASASSQVSDDSYDTVKLLDYLAQSSSDGSAYSRSVSSHGDTDQSAEASLVESRVSLTGNTDALTPRYLRPNSAFYEGTDVVNSTPSKRSARLKLLNMLEQIAQIFQRTELSDVSIARISSRLASIDEIAREDMYRNCQQQRRGSRLHSSSTTASSLTWPHSDLDEYEQDARLPPEKLRVLSPPQWATGKVAPTVLSSFKAFSAAQDLGDTMEAFDKLLLDCGLKGVKMEEPWHLYCHIRSAVYGKLGFRHRQLFKLLDARFNLDVYRRRPAARKRVCIIGAGPVGLRAAVETVLLGGQVVVLEKRTNFIRENMLHLWPWVVQDLASLGSRIFFPHFCKSKMYFHVSTRQLQVILLKVALLVGVTVHTSTEFQSLVPPSLDGNGNAFYSVATQPQIPVMEFTAVLGASGTNDKLSKAAGINRFVFSRKEALGVVCYFPNLGTSEETKVKEFSWTAHLKSYMLDKMRKIGLDLENIVYYRGEMHYLVMTPKRQNLLDRHVVKVNHHNPKDLVMNENVNQSALHEFARCVVDFAGIPRRTEFARVNLFDFSARTRADKAANILTSHGKKLYVGLIGDLLLEPLWHEGVGTCRGFLGALDSVWMVAQIGKKSDEQLLADRELAYRVMQRLSGHHRDDMQKNVRKYTVDPRSRYTVNFPQLH